MLMPKSDGLYTGGATFGDLPIHLDYISGFKERGLAVIYDNPIFAGSKLSYPFLPDLLTAGLTNLFPLNISLILPTLILSITAVALLYQLTFKITGRRLAAFITPLLFFFNGSLVGLYYFFQDKANIFTMQKEYAHLGEINLRFSNVIADYLLPQRTFVWGLVLGLFALWFLWQKKYYKYALIVGLMPLFHTHTFISFALVSGIYFLLQPSKKFLSALFIIAALFLIQAPLLLKTSHTNFITWHVGWMAEHDNLLIFWLKNLGVPLVLLVPAFISGSARLKKFALPFLALFVITNLFQFQPHSYDNMKIMLWGFLMLCILLANWLAQIPKYLALIFIILLTTTGVLSVYRETYVTWRLFDNADLQVANFVKNKTSKDALFLTSDKHNNPINTLAGRKVFLGFKGWLWTHGIDYGKRGQVVTEIYQGDPRAKDQIQRNTIDYIVLERDKYGDLFINEPFFHTNFKQIYNQGNYLIFDTSRGPGN